MPELATTEMGGPRAYEILSVHPAQPPIAAIALYMDGRLGEQAQARIQEALEATPVSIGASAHAAKGDGRFQQYFAGLARRALFEAIAQTCGGLSEQALRDPHRVAKALQWILEKPPEPFVCHPNTGLLMWSYSPRTGVCVVAAIPLVKLARCLARTATFIAEGIQAGEARRHAETEAA